MRFQMARHLGRLKRESARARAAFRGAVNATALARAGFRAPTPDALPPEFSPTDYVHFLLYIDAEIEHGLMVQYLYAAYSLGGPQVPEEHRPMIQGWREIILGIAKEEMGHLLSVQNILRLTGGPLDFGRDDFPWSTPFYPFPFSLEPLTLRSLAAYVYAESPVDWSGPEADEVKKLVHEVASEPHQVSALFEEMIRLMKDPDFIPDEVFQPETWPYQANWDEWGRGYQGGRRGDSTGANPRARPTSSSSPSPPATTRSPASRRSPSRARTPRRPTPPSLSHFARFLQIYREMKKLEPVCQRDGWSPARNVASNPYIPEEDGATPDHTESCGRPCDAITNPEARTLGAPVQRPLPDAPDVPVAQLRAVGRRGRERAEVPAGDGHQRDLRRDVQPAGHRRRADADAAHRHARGRRGEDRRPAVPDAVHAAPADGRGQPLAPAQATAAGVAHAHHGAAPA